MLVCAGPPRIVAIVSLTGWRSRAVEGTMAVVLIAVCATAVVRTLSHSKPPPPGPHSASLPADGRLRATLDVTTGTPALTIDFGNLGSGRTLLRVTTPAGSPAPRLAADGDGAAVGAGNGVIKVSATDATAVTITLSSAVSWQLDLAGGTTRTVGDLRGGRVTGVSITKGSNIIDLTMPGPAGRVPVRLAAGASQLLLSVPAGAAVRVATSAGAGRISLNGAAHVGVVGGSAYMTPSWDQGAPGFDVDATAGASRITVTTRAA